jgi:hypothetical protein
MNRRCENISMTLKMLKQTEDCRNCGRLQRTHQPQLLRIGVNATPAIQNQCIINVAGVYAEIIDKTS